MKNYTEEALKAGVGGTPQICQSALIELLQELFKGCKYSSPEGKRTLKIIRQGLSIPTGSDEEVDTDDASTPYIIVRMEGGEISDDSSPQLVEFSLEICAYDDSVKSDGYLDVMNIKEKIIQRVCSAPYFGGCFTILKPIAWAVQKDPAAPYFYGACVLTCTAPALTQDTELARFV